MKMANRELVGFLQNSYTLRGYYSIIAREQKY